MTATRLYPTPLFSARAGQDKDTLCTVNVAIASQSAITRLHKVGKGTGRRMHGLSAMFNSVHQSSR